GPSNPTIAPARTCISIPSTTARPPWILTSCSVVRTVSAFVVTGEGILAVETGAVWLIMALGEPEQAGSGPARSERDWLRPSFPRLAADESPCDLGRVSSVGCFG